MYLAALTQVCNAMEVLDAKLHGDYLLSQSAPGSPSGDDEVAYTPINSPAPEQEPGADILESLLKRRSGQLNNVPSASTGEDQRHVTENAFSKNVTGKTGK
jgi:hypothetical protein